MKQATKDAQPSMATIGKASQKYKEFNIIETNLLDAEKMVSKKFTADAIDEFQI